MAGLKAPSILALLGAGLFLGLASGPVALSATEPASWPAQPPPDDAHSRLYVLNFAHQDIDQVAGQVLGVVIQSPFEIDPSVHGEMSLAVEQRLTRSQLLSAFETALARSGARVVKQGAVLKVVPLSSPPAVMERARAAGARAVKPTLALRAAPRLPAFILIVLAITVLLLAVALMLARKMSFSFGPIASPIRTGAAAREAVLEQVCDFGAVAPDVLALARSSAAGSGRPVEHELNRMGAVSDDALTAAYARVTGLPVWKPDDLPPLGEASGLGAKAHGLTRRGFVPVQLDGARLTLATSDPLDDGALAGVALETARVVRIMICSPAEIRRAIAAA